MRTKEFAKRAVWAAALAGAVTVAVVVAVLGGCAGSGPYRNAAIALQDPPSECVEIYKASDNDIREVASDFTLSDSQRDTRLQAIQNEISDSYNVKGNRDCWNTAHEHHLGYELFYTEFDDAGQAVDRVEGAAYEKSELYLIETYLRNQLKPDPGAGVTTRSNERQQGLNIVVFVHGWHGSARATDPYSIEFKGILQDIAQRESRYASTMGSRRPSGSSLTHREHRVVGIEVAWRGDSLLWPSFASVWDRKLAAETVSIGAVHELFAFLNQFYLDDSCHSGRSGNYAPCDRVHLLTIGHSFGALIAFRSLVSRLQSGLDADPCFRAYGFGDMTILLNPAVEAARYRALFNEGLSRHMVLSEYFGDPTLDPHKCLSGGGSSTATPESVAPGSVPSVQLPTVVTLQSMGDSATGTFFPIFRRLTTPFQKTLTPQESQDKNSAIGWNDDFRTHSLKLADKSAASDLCTTAEKAAEKPPAVSQRVTNMPAPTGTPLPSASLTFCPFIQTNSTQSDTTSQRVRAHAQHMQLEYAPGTTKLLPNYLPLWSVNVSTDIMKNHDDFWNPQIVRLVSILFEDAYEQTEHLHHETDIQ